MNREQLERQFEILKTDVSSLVDTTDIIKRLNKDDNGIYHLARGKEIANDEERVRRILGAISPEMSIDSIQGLLRNFRDYSLPEGYPEIERCMVEEYKKCVTHNKLIKRLLILIRLDGILEFGKTPLCGDADPVDFLRGIINDSQIDYKDTLLAFLDLSLRETEPAFIIDDEQEVPGEKLDKAVMYLSLLSKEDILEYSGNDMAINQDTQGTFCQFFHTTPSVAKAFPYIMQGCSKAMELFKAARIRDKRHDSDGEAADFLSELTLDSNVPIAFDNQPYNNIILQCANAGMSISGWVRDAKLCLKDTNDDVQAWMLERISPSVANAMMTRPGYYMLSLSDEGISVFENSEEYKELREYIVSNGYLKDVWHGIADYGDFYTKLAFYEIDTRQENGNGGFVRFFNFDNEKLDSDHSTFGHLLWGFDREDKTKIYRFVSTQTIAEENYRLDMELYNSYRFAISKNPVFLSEILTPIEGTIGVYDDHVTPFWGPHCVEEEGSVNVSLFEDPLNNYNSVIDLNPRDVVKSTDTPRTVFDYLDSKSALRADGDIKFNADRVLLINTSWPMKPTWISCRGRREEGGIVIQYPESENVRAYKVDESRVNPWYLAYKLSNLTSQFNLRKNNDGRIEEAQFLKIYLDIPSLEEQKNEIEKKINDEIEWRKQQVGAVDTLFNLSHTIGLPASRIQALLGNLQDMCARNPEVSSQLKKITDNFDYILRVIDSTSQDYKAFNENLKEMRILPVLESFISSFSSLPFGIDPLINKSKVDPDVRLKIDKTLFSVMMDNILRNAHRHGFDKKVSSENKVSIELEVVQYEGVAHLMLSVRNNGKKMEEGFSVYDYISRGKHGKRTGNTGQGGYDIYQIVKKFNGYLGIRNDDQWNFIIDILIPVMGTDLETLKTPYPYGTLL